MVSPGGAAGLETLNVPGKTDGNMAPAPIQRGTGTTITARFPARVLNELLPPLAAMLTVLPALP